MLQRNVTRAGRDAHLTHAALVGLHTLCCGLPIVVMGVVSAAGAASTLTLASRNLLQVHDFMHENEVWTVVASAILVVIGAVLEARARRKVSVAGFPWLFAVSVGCFLLNAGVVMFHRVA
ncbi:MAG: hypothetical protein ABL883_02865 [Terricaulis sp.]